MFITLIPPCHFFKTYSIHILTQFFLSSKITFITSLENRSERNRIRKGKNAAVDFCAGLLSNYQADMATLSVNFAPSYCLFAEGNLVFLD